MKKNVKEIPENEELTCQTHLQNISFKYYFVKKKTKENSNNNK